MYNLGKDLKWHDASQLIKSASLNKFKPGECLIPANSKKREVFIILKGLVRSYSINDKGDEITMSLMIENNIVASMEQILLDQKSKHSFFFFVFSSSFLP